MERLESSGVRPRQARYQAALRPDMKCTTHSKVLPDFLLAPIHRFGPRPCIYRAFIPSKLLIGPRPCTFARQVREPLRRPSGFKLLQGFTLHLQLHLRVLFHDLRVTLAQHLRYPFIRYSSCTQPCGINGSQVVDAEIGHLRTAKRFVPNRLEGGLVSPAIAITRKEKLALRCDCHLAPQRFSCQRSKGNFGDAVRSFRVRDPDDLVRKVHLVLLDRSQFLIDSQTRFRNDLHDIAQISSRRPEIPPPNRGSLRATSCGPLCSTSA